MLGERKVYGVHLANENACDEEQTFCDRSLGGSVFPGVFSSLLVLKICLDLSSGLSVGRF